MGQRLSRVGVFLLIMALVGAGVVGCSRPAEERAATEPTEVLPTGAPSGGSETATTIEETVVSAVTSIPEATPSGAEEQPTAAPGEEGPAAVEPTATTQTEGAPAPAATKPPAGGSGAGTTWHTVKRGETLSTIARRYGTTWQAIARANNLVNPNQIYAGQKLKIPTSGGTTGGTAGCRVRHKVKKGEWVWQIARNYGVSPYDILAANGLTIQSANTIYPGRVLCIP